MKSYAPLACSTLLLLTSLLACGDDSGDPASESMTAAATTGQVSGATSDDASSGTSGESPGTSSTPASSTAPGSESTAAADESSTGEDPFAECERGVLAPDFGVVDAMGVPGPPRWFGPGADPKTGELLDDGASTYVVSATYIALRPEALEDFFGYSQANSEALFSNPGMVAAQLGVSLGCAVGRTFTVWEDEDALMAFVGSDAHLQSVSAFPSLSRGGSTLSVWAEPALASEISWAAALERIVDEPTYD